MVQYVQNNDVAYCDGYRFTRDKRTGYFLASRKINGRRPRLHVYVWESVNGKIPDGFHIHHLDGDKNNNEIENLAIMGAVEHVKLHGGMLTETAKAKMRENLLSNAVPKAKKWHGSASGKVWHSKHAQETWRNLQAREYQCSYCGAAFMSKNHYAANQNHFCSNKCKSAFRRASGVDDVPKICEKCGGEYVANKYQATKFCPDCKNRSR